MAILERGIMMQDLMTVKDLQDYLGVGRAKAYELVNVPDFPVLRIGRSIRIPKDLLEEWIIENTGGNLSD